MQTPCHCYATVMPLPCQHRHAYLRLSTEELTTGIPVFVQVLHMAGYQPVLNTGKSEAMDLIRDFQWESCRWGSPRLWDPHGSEASPHEVFMLLSRRAEEMFGMVRWRMDEMTERGLGGELEEDNVRILQVVSSVDELLRNRRDFMHPMHPFSGSSRVWEVFNKWFADKQRQYLALLSERCEHLRGLLREQSSRRLAWRQRKFNAGYSEAWEKQRETGREFVPFDRLYDDDPLDLDDLLYDNALDWFGNLIAVGEFLAG